MSFNSLILFLHVFSGVIWVGGMIAIRVAVHPVLQSFEDGKLKLGTTLRVVGRLFNLVIPFIILLILTALYFELALNIKGSLTHIKEAIWTIMTINFIVMYIKRLKAVKLFESGELSKVKETVSIIPKLLLPINIVLGVIAIFIGAILRGF